MSLVLRNETGAAVFVPPSLGPDGGCVVSVTALAKGRGFPLYVDSFGPRNPERTLSDFFRLEPGRIMHRYVTLPISRRLAAARAFRVYVGLLCLGDDDFEGVWRGNVSLPPEEVRVCRTWKECTGTVSLAGPPRV